jgi:hypothetical protein
MKQIYNFCLFTFFALATTSMSFAQNTPVFTNAQGTAGTLDGVPFTISVTTNYSTTVSNQNLSVAGYAGAPLSASQPCFEYAINATGSLTITFATPITNLKLYLVYWRNQQATFNHNYNLISGTLAQVVSANEISTTSYSHAVLEFPGPITTLIINRNGFVGYEALSFANGIWLGAEDWNKTASNFKLFPNPSSDYIQVSGLTETENYTLNNILGAEVGRGEISGNEKISVADLTKGVYFLKFEKGKTIKFVKE